MADKFDISQEQFEKIESYLMGKMRVQERALFEEELSVSEDLRREVEIHRKMFASVEAGETMKAFEKISHESTGKRNSVLKYIGIAAGLAALIAVGSYFLLSGSVEEELFA